MSSDSGCSDKRELAEFLNEARLITSRMLFLINKFVAVTSTNLQRKQLANLYLSNLESDVGVIQVISRKLRRFS